MISLVMSTYNGAQYIIEQLDSIKNQTRKVDEVIIIDDNSTDETFSIIKEYILKNDLDWIVKKNLINLGWKRNFFESIKMTTGDIVFLCDQDDIWDNNKIEYMAKCFEDNKKIKLLQSNYEIYYYKKSTNIRQKIRTIIDNISHKKSKNSLVIKQRKIKPDFLHQEPGCVMAFKKELFTKYEKFWNINIGHDLQLTIFSLLDDSYFKFDYSSIKWRRHINNASTPEQFNCKKREIELTENDSIFSIIRIIIQNNDIVMSRKFYKYLRNSERLNNIRKKVVIEKRKLYWFFYFVYFRYFVRKRDIVSDLKYAK